MLGQIDRNYNSLLTDVDHSWDGFSRCHLFEDSIHRSFLYFFGSLKSYINTRRSLTIKCQMLCMIWQSARVRASDRIVATVIIAETDYQDSPGARFLASVHEFLRPL